MKRVLLGLAVMGLTLYPALVRAAETSLTAEGQPMRYAYVQGDGQKFQEQQWMHEGYSGGLDDFTFESKDLPEDIRVFMQGRSLTADDDYESELLVEKKDFGYVRLEYEQFTKYYDPTGGVYYPFGVLQVNTLHSQDLALRIGRLSVEAGLTVEDFPEITFQFERHYKDGAKSRLSWAPVREGSITRNIAPSFQDLKEATNEVELREAYTIKGVDLKGEQRWEFTDVDSRREERSFSTTTTASDKKIRVQNQLPQTRAFSTMGAAEHWSEDERVFMGSAYQFVHLSNRELEEIFEMNENRVVANFANPKQIRDARAENTYNDHTWTASTMVLPWPWLSVTGKLRTGATARAGNSRYPSDTTAGAPDGIINNIDVSDTQDKVARLGEGISLRYTQIPKTALYNDFEFEQVRNWLGEDRTSIAGQSAASTGEIFSRETITRILSGIWTIGGQVVPCNFVNLTGHVRYRRDNNDFDDQRETPATAAGAKSAFMDGLYLTSKELAVKAVFKPKPWLRPAVRYQYQLRDYASRIEDEGPVGTEMDSHIFTFEISVQPADKWLIISAFSPQYSWVESPIARNMGQGATPRFQANLLSWITNVNYYITDAIRSTAGLELAKADNFNDFAESGLPLAADYGQSDVFFGLEWDFMPGVTLSADYAFYHYSTNHLVDSGDYNANVFWLKTIFNWG